MPYLLRTGCPCGSFPIPSARVTSESRGFLFWFPKSPDSILGEELGQSDRSDEPPAKRARDAANEDQGDRGRRRAPAKAGRSADADRERSRRPAKTRTMWNKIAEWSAWTTPHRSFIPWPLSSINRTPSSGRLFFHHRIGVLGAPDGGPGCLRQPELPSFTAYPLIHTALTVATLPAIQGSV